MITILAEKPDVGNKIAAALDKITLASGKTVTFETLKANEKAVKSQQAKDGFLTIRFMGQECNVTWGYGHLVQLRDAKDYDPSYKNWRKMPCPFIPGHYKVKVREGGTSFDSKVKDQFNLVKKLFNSSDLIINATDFDREGEVIFSYIYELAGSNKPVQRACFASQTKEGIQDAFKKLKDWNEVKNVEAAGRMRSIADWVVGINLTTTLTLKQFGREVLSIGRVQTPTLKILVDRELAIRDFQPEKYWTVGAVFRTNNGETYSATHTKGRFLKKADAEDVIERLNAGNREGAVDSVSEKRFEKEPPQLYSLSALQMDANAKYGLTLKETLAAAQALYDNGYTTYPRTDSRYLTEDMEPVVNRVLDSLAKNSTYAHLINGRSRAFKKSRYFDDKKVESHFAIIPTTSIPHGLTGDQEKVYDLICKSVICMLYGNALLNKTTVTTISAGEVFTSSGTVILDEGFMSVIGRDKDVVLPKIKKGDAVTGSFDLKEKETEPPKRYSDKTLLAAMISAGKDLEDEELRKILADPSVSGIGTPATRDAIIETLINRGYAARNKKVLSATDRGIWLIQNLPIADVKSPEMTARWEKRLHEIERGSESASEFQRDIEETVRKWCKEISGSSLTPSTTSSYRHSGVLSFNCPVCGHPMMKQSWGYGCSNYRVGGCKFSIGKICEKTLSENQVKRLVTSKDSGMIKGFKSKTGKTFDARLVLDENNKIQFRFRD